MVRSTGGAGTQSSLAGVGTSAGDVAVDAGLRAHMLKVYELYGVRRPFDRNRRHVVCANRVGAESDDQPQLVELGYHLVALGGRVDLSFGQNRLSTSALQAMFWAFAVLMGLSMSRIFMMMFRTDPLPRHSLQPPLPSPV